MNNTKLKKLWDVLSTILVTLVVLCAIFLMGSRLLGFHVFTILSPSMEPKYSPGDLIYVKEVTPAQVEVGDTITFVLKEGVVATHQVVEKNDAKGQFITKGLANDHNDAPVSYRNLIGIPQFSIPLLGYVSNFVQTPPGMYIAIAVGVILLIAVFLPDLIKGKKKEAAPSKETEASAEPQVPAEGESVNSTEESPSPTEDKEETRSEDQ